MLKKNCRTCGHKETLDVLYIPPTLLIFLRSRSLRIPTHISILYVEQEVTGDDTTALESVLECDIQRKTLLDREKEIQSRIAQGWDHWGQAMLAQPKFNLEKFTVINLSLTQQCWVISLTLRFILLTCPRSRLHSVFYVVSWWVSAVVLCGAPVWRSWWVRHTADAVYFSSWVFPFTCSSQGARWQSSHTIVWGVCRAAGHRGRQGSCQGQRHPQWPWLQSWDADKADQRVLWRLENEDSVSESTLFTVSVNVLYATIVAIVILVMTYVSRLECLYAVLCHIVIGSNSGWSWLMLAVLADLTSSCLMSRQTC